MRRTSKCPLQMNTQATLTSPEVRALHVELDEQLGMLNRLRRAIEIARHSDVSKVTWTDAETAKRLTATLREACDSYFREGEYAS
jgi:hypothetical protein